MLKQATKRISHGCMNKESGQYAVNQHSETIEKNNRIPQEFSVKSLRNFWTQ